MPKPSQSFLKPKRVTTPYTVRLPDSTLTQLRSVQARAEEEAKHLEFDVAEVIDTAILDAVQSACAELDRLKGS